MNMYNNSLSHLNKHCIKKSNKHLSTERSIKTSNKINVTANSTQNDK